MTTWKARAAFMTILLLCADISVLAAQTLPRERVTQDVRWLIRALEQIHPDPYTAFGGKVEFKRRAQELLARVPADGLDPSGIHKLLEPFLGDLGDGHTRLLPPERPADAAPPRVLPLRFRVATDVVFVERAAAGYEDLVGYRVRSIEGQPIERMQSQVSRVLPVENEYGAARSLARAIQSTRYAERLFRRSLDTLTLGLLRPDGTEIDRQVPFVPSAVWEFPPDTVTPLARELAGNTGPIWWRILEESNVGYLRLRAIEGREAFEEARGRQDLPGYVARYYTRYLGRAAPDDLDQALAGIECFTTTVTDLLTAMRDRGAAYLIVDVRGNGGGWSSLMLPLYLLAFGDAYLDRPFPEVWVDVASPQFLALNGWTPDDLATEWGPEYEVGDYRFDAPGRPRGERRREEYLKELEALKCGLASRITQLDGRPLHKVAVVVLTDSGTFSAAFQLAYHLWHLGAVMVGTPSAQAGNAYTNVLPIELPNSGLRGSIARSAQVFFPRDEELGRVLMPDFPMAWADFARYGFKPESEVRYALDLIAAGRVSAVPTRD